MSSAVSSVLAVWFVMMLGTAASTWGLSLPAVAAVVSTIAVMAVSAIKVGLVMAFFMELRSAPFAWQLAGTIWVGVATSMVVIIYLL